MSRDPRVDLYIERAQPFARPLLEHVRDRVNRAVPEAVETLKWGAPAFTLDGKILLMTRTKRITTANEWLAEGKKRNWKYENC